MMQSNQLLTLERTQCQQHADSKKRALEIVSELICTNLPIEPQEIFAAFVNRERLGSTAIGHSIAIPHVRFEHISQPMGAFIQFDSGIDFAAADTQTVDLIFALAVPAETHEDHLKILAHLAKVFSQEHVRQELRHANNPQQLFDIFSKHYDKHAITS